MTVPPAINPLLSFDIDTDGFTDGFTEKFDSLSDGIKRMIHGSKEYQEISGIPVDKVAEAVGGEVLDSEIPF